MSPSPLSRGAIIIGIGLGSILSSKSARNDSWIPWPIRYPSSDPSQSQSLPGQVLVWGSSFGRIPRPISGLNKNVTKVAATNDFGAIIDENGKVFAFKVAEGKDLVYEIEVKGKPENIAVCRSLGQVVVSDSRGRVHISSVVNDSFSPAQILTDTLRRARIKNIDCGKNHCLALSDRDEIFAWGINNLNGQLGERDSNSSELSDLKKPAKLDTFGLKIRQIACGDNHTIMLDEQGALYGLGNDQWAQLGIFAEPWLQSHEKTSNKVRKAKLLNGVTGCDIAGGGQHSVMLVRDGTIFSFGFNQWGQLGHHNFSSLAPPSPIADFSIRATAIAAGENHTCMIRETGELWCIGGNQYGQLGNGTLQPSMTWKKVRAERKPIKPSYLHANGDVCAVVIPCQETTQS